MVIKNRADYRRGYEWLKVLEEAVNNGSFSNPKVAKEMIRDQKRILRTYAHKGTDEDLGLGFYGERRVIKHYGNGGIDGHLELISIPKVFFTEEEAETFVKDFIVIKHPSSPYDCTGFAFTGWYKVFRRRGQFWCYHRVCLDV